MNKSYQKGELLNHRAVNKTPVEVVSLIITGALMAPLKRNNSSSLYKNP